MSGKSGRFPGRRGDYESLTGKPKRPRISEWQEGMKTIQKKKRVKEQRGPPSRSAVQKERVVIGEETGGSATKKGI